MNVLSPRLEEKILILLDLGIAQIRKQEAKECDARNDDAKCDVVTTMADQLRNAKGLLKEMKSGKDKYGHDCESEDPEVIRVYEKYVEKLQQEFIRIAVIRS